MMNERTNWVHGHPQVLDCPIFSKYFTNVGFLDVLCQCLYHNLNIRQCRSDWLLPSMITLPLYFSALVSHPWA